MAIDMFDTRVMLEAMKIEKRPGTFLKNRFFSIEKTTDKKLVDLDTKTGTRGVAKVCNPNGPGNVVEKPGYTNRSVEPPHFNEKTDITEEDLFKRGAGENIYSPQGPNQRALEHLNEMLTEIDDRIVRAEELMIRDVLFDSEIDYTEGDVEYSVSFTRDADLSLGTVAAADRWDAETAMIIPSLKSWATLLRKIGGVNPDTLVLGTTACENFLSNDILRASLDTRRIDLGQIDPKYLDGGVTYVGHIMGTNLEVYQYDEWTLNEGTGEDDAIIPAKKILMGSSKSGAVMQYGAVTVAKTEAGQPSLRVYPEKRVPDRFIEKEPDKEWLRLQSRPLPIPRNNNAFLTAQVLA